MDEDRPKETPFVLDDNQRAFHLEEFKSLRIELVSKGDNYDRFKVWFIVSIAAYFAWAATFLTHGKDGDFCAVVPRSIAHVIALMPIGVTVIAAFGAAFYLNFFRTYGAYARRLEMHLGHSELGWERHWNGKSVPDGPRAKKYSVLMMADPFWPIVGIVIGVLCIITYVQPGVGKCESVTRASAPQRASSPRHKIFPPEVAVPAEFNACCIII